MQQDNFVIKSILLTFTVSFFLTGCQNRKSFEFEDITKHIVDTLIHKDCCDTFMITKNVNIDFKTNLQYLPISFLKAKGIDTNILYDPFRKIAIDSNRLEQYLTNRKKMISLLEYTSINDFPITRPLPKKKMILVFSEIYVDNYENAAVFVSTISHNTRTYLIIANKNKEKYVVKYSQILEGYFPWTEYIE